MSDLPVVASNGETVLKESEAVYAKNSLLALGVRALAGHLWLTSARLIFREADGAIRSFPLCHVLNAEPSEYHIKTASGGGDAFTKTSTLMRVTFNEGGREYFAVKDMAGWTEAIKDARGAAPILAYTDHPNRRSGVETTPGQIALWIGGALIGLCLALTCCVMITLFSPAIIAILGSIGR